MSPRHIFLVFAFSFVYVFSQSSFAGYTSKGNAESKIKTVDPPLTNADLASTATNIQKCVNIGKNTSDSNSTRNAIIYGQLKELKYGGAAGILPDQNWNITWGENGTPINIEFPKPLGLSKRTVAPESLASAAANFINVNKAMFGLDDPTKEMRCTGSSTDDYGKHHVRFSQFHNDLPMWDKDVVMHFDAGGNLYSINARYAPSPKDLDKKVIIVDSLEAVMIAVSKLGETVSIDSLSQSMKNLLSYQGPWAREGIWTDCFSHVSYQSWKVEIRPNLKDHWIYYINAADGAVLTCYNASPTEGPAISVYAVDLHGVPRSIQVYNFDSVYCMIDATKQMWVPNQNRANIYNNPLGAIWTLEYSGNFLNVVSRDNKWNDPIAVSAHNNASVVFDYYFQKFGRKSLDNNGSTIMSIVHWPDANGNPYDNAFWNGQFIAYGDGLNYKPFAGGLDIAGHEMTHGVITYTVDLDYLFQSGALNESIADVFAVMIDNDDWLIGEDVGRSGPIRNLQNPRACGQPMTMSEFVVCPYNYDNGGVHYNSGITNYAAYLIASNIGREKTEKIYYRILDAGYLTSEAQFVDMRLAALTATGEFFGKTSNEYSVVRAAFDSVGIFPDDSHPDPDKPLPGTQWIAALGTDDDNLYAMNPGAKSITERIQMGGTKVLSASSGPVTVSGDGHTVLYVDKSYNIKSMKYDGSSEKIIDKGKWWSIALSPDGSKLAATTIYADALIYVMDLKNPSKSVTYNLRSLLDGVDSAAVLYADKLNWDGGNRFIALDAYHEEIDGGDTSKYWNIYILDTGSGELFPVFTNHDKGINYCNPCFSKTSPGLLLYDKMNSVKENCAIHVCDYFNNVDSTIEDNGNSYAFPEFSPNDSCIVFQRLMGTNYGLRKLVLNKSRFSEIESSKTFLEGMKRPLWFAIRDSSSIVNNKIKKNYLFSGLMNYPNPFRGKTSLKFNLATASQVGITVYNMEGKLVSAIDCGNRPAGSHTVEWDGSDAKGKQLPGGVYFFKLKAKNHESEVSVNHKMILVR